MDTHKLERTDSPDSIYSRHVTLMFALTPHSLCGSAQFLSAGEPPGSEIEPAARANLESTGGWRPRQRFDRKAGFSTLQAAQLHRFQTVRVEHMCIQKLL
ncbi:unnamed protein product [Pleuronectes platessa]|uniref:Uncharacterized protein n=1 Tax=Pleuronectes platessa TaxID=8262 RepID=A0A9N7ULS8_PLEPL|nr:unnamed protein product [Pleuronectes platessa]